MVAAVFTAALAIVMAGCGSGDEELSSRQADELLALIDQIRQAANQGNCDEAIAEASELEAEVASLTDVPDDALRPLTAGTAHLEGLVIQECDAEGVETTTTETTTTTQETTTTTEPTTTETTTTQTTTEAETTTLPEDDGDDGGDEGSGGTGAGGTEAPSGGSGRGGE